MEQIVSFSDAHLGNYYARSKTFLQTLERHEGAKQLISLGDLFERDGVLSATEWKIIEFLRAYREKIVFIEGNHDPIEGGIIKRFIGAKVRKKYVVTINGKKFCFRHGHQFHDSYGIYNWRIVDRVSLHLLRFLQCFKNTPVGRIVKACHTKFSERIAKKAKQYAYQNKFDVIVCAHTHQVFADCAIQPHYYNCGGFLTFDDTCSYVTVNELGEILHHHVDPID